MEPCEEARQLLLGAEKDLRAFAGMREPEVFAEEIFGFHAQQAVEKCLKAWITLFGAEYPRTHDLSFLLSRLESLGERVEEFEDLVEFNPYAVQFRYEAYDNLGMPVDRDETVNRVSQLVTRVRAELDGRLPAR
jgi:HEPN domain-containing protein